MNALSRCINTITSLEDTTTNEDTHEGNSNKMNEYADEDADKQYHNSPLGGHQETERT